jgi:hypothetical protein
MAPDETGAAGYHRSFWIIHKKLFFSMAYSINRIAEPGRSRGD